MNLAPDFGYPATGQTSAVWQSVVARLPGDVIDEPTGGGGSMVRRRCRTRNCRPAAQRHRLRIGVSDGMAEKVVSAAAQRERSAAGIGAPLAWHPARSLGFANPRSSAMFIGARSLNASAGLPRRNRIWADGSNISGEPKMRKCASNRSTTLLPGTSACFSQLGVGSPPAGTSGPEESGDGGPG
jgi:hypothetical protein